MMNILGRARKSSSFRKIMARHLSAETGVM
jgi:hypothetical protein